MALGIKLVLFSIVFQTTLASCPNGWIHHDDSCYHFSHDLEPWTGAMAMCRLMGGKLLEIDSAAETAYVGSFVTSLNRNFWIGLSDVQEEGIWIWMESQVKLSPGVYANWAPSEPNNDGGDGNCVTINAKTNGQWFDWHCKDALNYVCETFSE